MKKHCLAVIVALLSFLLIGSAEICLAGRAEGIPPSNRGLEARDTGRRVLIGFKDGLGHQEAERHRIRILDLSGEIQHSFTFVPLVSARLPENLIAKLKGQADIAYIEDDIIVQAVQQEIPWGVDRIDADLVWNTNTGKGVKVAMLDTGIDYDHPDLAGNIAGGVNYTGWVWRDGSTNKLYWDDKNGHGSYCAGIVAAMDNNIGVVGAAPDASLWAVKVLDDNGSGHISDIIQGLEWCVNNGIDIVSMSFGAKEYSESLANACKAAYDAGILLVAAAGNENGGAVIYPAAYDSVIAVSATNINDEFAGFSSTGAEIELAAPAVDIKSTYKNGGYAVGSGTSMACPHVAGTAALIWASQPMLTNQQVRQRLQETAEDLGDYGPDDLYGYGLVDAAAAAKPADIYDLAVSAIFATSPVIAGDAVEIDVTVENVGNKDVTSDITVALIDETDGITIGTKIITGGLPAGAFITLTYIWQTDDFTSIGSHTITAEHNFPDDDGGNDFRSVIVTVEKKPTAPMAWVNINMSKQILWKWWRAAAKVSVTDEDMMSIDGATIDGHWSGVYERNVRGTIRNGQVAFSTGLIQISGIVTFTVDKIVKNGQEYLLSGETGDSISH